MYFAQKSSSKIFLYLVSMLKKWWINLSRYTKIEWTFFLFYFYAYRMLIDLEYNFWEEQFVGISRDAIETNLAFGTAALPAFFLFYKGLHYCIRDKRIWTFAVLVVLFLVGYSIYQKAVYFVYAHLDFLFSEGLRSRTFRFYQSKSLGYSLGYMFRELGVIAALAYFIHYLKQSEQLKTLKEQQLMSELNYLKAQLQPHFFFNTLNNIYALALDQSKDTAPMVAKLAEMMRYILYQSDQPKVPLQQEVDFLENYVDIEKIRHHENVAISFDVQGSTDGASIEPLLLLPFVENAFKHGANKTIGEAFVHIALYVADGELVLQVGNSKPGTGGKEDIAGLGLQNVEKRLELLYGARYQLHVTEDENSYQVDLTLNKL